MTPKRNKVPGWRKKATRATAWGPAAPGPLGAETQSPGHRKRRSAAPEARSPGGRAGTAPRPSEQVRRRPTSGRGPARGLAVTFGGKLLELVVFFQETQVDRLLLLGHRAAPSSAALRAATKLGASVLARRRDGPRRRNHRD